MVTPYCTESAKVQSCVPGHPLRGWPAQTGGKVDGIGECVRAYGVELSSVPIDDPLATPAALNAGVDQADSRLTSRLHSARPVLSQNRTSAERRTWLPRSQSWGSVAQ